MKRILHLLAMLLYLSSRASGHGFDLAVNYNSNSVPASISAFSQGPYFDQQQLTAAPDDLFLSAFSRRQHGSKRDLFSCDSRFCGNIWTMATLHRHLQHCQSAVFFWWVSCNSGTTGYFCRRFRSMGRKP